MMCSVILAIHNALQPYKEKKVNALESVYLTILAVMAVMPLLKPEYESTGIKHVVSSLLLISIILTVVLFVCKLVRLLKGRGEPNERFVELEEYESIEGSSDIDLEQRERRRIFRIIFG